MRLLILLLLSCLLLSGACSKDGDDFGGLNPDQMVLRSDGTRLTVKQQFAHIRALLADLGYAQLCGILLSANASPPKNGQTQQDTETLQRIQVTVCQQARDN